MSDQKPSPAEDLDAIPVKGMNPKFLAAGAGAVALVLVAVVMIKVVGGSKLPEETQANTPVAADTSKMTQEELKAHLELTKKGLVVADGEAAKKKAAEDAVKAAAEAKKKEEEAAAAPPVAGGGAPAPAPVGGKAAKKQAAKLDDIAADITGTLQ